MNRVFIIAEAGVNHNGDIEIAKKLVDEAVEAGADAIKFQTFKADSLVCKDAQKAEYQMKTSDSRESQWNMLKRLELTENMHNILIDYCRQKGIKFLSTPFSCEDIDFLEQYDLDIYKIPSGEITNYPYLEKIGKLKKKILLSTGMSSLDEVAEAVEVLKAVGTSEIVILHCSTEYPVPDDDVNLKAMITMCDKLGFPIGFSDHTRGIVAGIAATAMGAVVLEKHFTLDRNMSGPDHKASLEPKELRELITAVRQVEKMLGDGRKTPAASEIKNINVVRKSIVAKREIRKGEIFNAENITTKRPGTGMSPMKWKEVIGLQARRNYSEDEQI